MDGLFTILILLLISILIVPLIFAWRTHDRVKELRNELFDIKIYLKALLEKAEKEKGKSTAETYSQPAVKQVYEPHVTVPKPKPVIEEQPKIGPEEIVKPKPIEPITVENKKIEVEPFSAKNDKDLKPLPRPLITPQTTPKKKTNFEQFIGEKLISLVGIAILVLGIFFTVKWAIGRHLISDAGKILIGLISGTLLIGLAHRLSKNYRTFSSILAGGGIAVLYFSIYQAYQSYHLLPQAGAFIAMIVVTIFAVILSVIYDKKELAVIALIGGFATPFFVSNGSGNYKILFSYLLILNIGMFVLANFKKWNLLNIIGYAFTILIFSLWMYNDYSPIKGQTGGGLLFATLFYFVFFATIIIYNVKNNSKFGALEIGLLLSNSLLYLGAGLFFLHTIQHGDFQGLFVIGLALINFVFAYVFYKKQNVDKNLIYLLIGLVLSFASLAGPIQLDGNYITLFWACEAVILYWLGSKTGISMIKNSSLAIVLFTIISLILDWNNNYFSVQINKLPIILNKSFITGLVVISALYVKLRWVKQDQNKILLWGFLSTTLYAKILEVIWVLLIYLVGMQELYYQTYTVYRLTEYQTVAMWIYHFAFVTLLAWYTFKYRSYQEKLAIALLGFLTLLFYPVANLKIFSLRQLSLEQHSHSFLFNQHYLLPIFALVIIYLLIQFIRHQMQSKENQVVIATWFLSIALLYIISAEIIHIWIYVDYQPGFDWWDSKRRAMKVAWPILWSLLSLSLMWMGMKHRVKHLRTISLSLFTLTIIKLFVYDISNVSQGGKIAAFIILGVVLLIVSFMYQKIKGLFISDDESANSEQSQNLNS